MVSALNLETAGELKTSSMMGHQCQTSVGKREAVKDPRDTIALVILALALETDASSSVYITLHLVLYSHS